MALETPMPAVTPPLASPAPSRLPRLAWLALVLVAAALPWLVSDYRLFQFAMILVTALAVLGLNILVGYNGQLSLGHGAIYALGAYITGILVSRFGVPYWLTLPVSALGCFGFGFAFGWPAVRLKGHHLALATLALAVLAPQLIKDQLLSSWTQGVSGITLTKPKVPFGLPLNDDQWLYCFVLAVTLLLFWVARNLLRGSIGRATIAIRENDIAALAMGVNVTRTKAITFGISAAYTGVAGSLAAVMTQFIAPDNFGMYLSIFLLVGVIVGGMGTIPGALIGAAFIQLVPNVAESISKSIPATVFGVCMILTMYLMPSGCVGLFERLWLGLRSRRSATPAAPSSPRSH